MRKKILLSKSKIKESVDCSLMLFNTLNNPKAKEWDKQTLAIFEKGRIVEKMARDKFPKGVLQDKIDNYEKVELTKSLLTTNKVVFEAAFTKKNTIVQFDILVQNDDSTFNAIEVKSSSKFKPEYETDVLVQYWIATLSGIKINHFELWFVNNQSVGKDDFFTKHDVTDFVKNNERLFWERLHKAQEILSLTKAPEAKRNSNCDKIDCPYRNFGKCKVEETADSVLSLPRFPNGWKAYHKVITSVNDPRFLQEYNYAEKNPLIYKSIKENSLVIDRENLMKDFSNWKFPLNFFDFETLMDAIPVLEGQKPFEQVVVQYSNHIWDGKNDKMEHSFFLHTKLSSPNLDLISSLISLFDKNEGSIVSYNQTFEKTMILNLAKKFPEYSDKLVAITNRLVDLMDLVKDYVYHPAFKGSYSLKVVSPTLLKEYGAYSDSLIKSGSEIASYYTEMVMTQDSSRKKLIQEALKRYCFYDTLNLFLLLKYLLDQNVDLKELVLKNNQDSESNGSKFDFKQIVSSLKFFIKGLI